jgi:hypothetical protein
MPIDRKGLPPSFLTTGMDFFASAGPFRQHFFRYDPTKKLDVSRSDIHPFSLVWSTKFAGATGIAAGSITP